jgi:hypothetical protein
MILTPLLKQHECIVLRVQKQMLLLDMFMTLLDSNAVAGTVQTDKVQEITCHAYDHGTRTKPLVV